MASPLSQHDNVSATSPTLPSKHSSNPLDDRSPTGLYMMQHDSLVTVRLSEPTPLSTHTSIGPDSIPSLGKSLLAPEVSARDYVPRDAMAENLDEIAEEEEETATAVTEQEFHQRVLQDKLLQTGAEVELPEGSLHQNITRISDTRSGGEESDPEEVNWEKLQEKEDEHSQKPDADNATAMLLARLEQENNKLAVNPKSVKVQPLTRQSIRKPRPPSMAQLQQMVSGPTPQALRYSMLPPPPLTDLEFYAALVKDYEQTVARLPTLVANKIRKGIPPPLRGVVWQSMSRARDSGLEDLYDRLCGESSPFESSIGKDLGRTFPGVEMFRDADGDGQQMLGRVLKCFSLYDPKIGYCQGLACIVGPLLMHMPDKQAFCVLVRLMDQYDLRNCYVQEMPGLHLRIYQFGELLRQNMPRLSARLQDLRVEPIYVSQWFLSFFAITCPLPMLFRIYDFVFAEGASETIMRVALSLMRKNQARILACTEFEDVMQLLLSRGLWDCYHYNADEFVDDFIELGGVVTAETLKTVEQQYYQERQAGLSTQTASTSTVQLPPDVTTAASRFLGRLWNTTSGTTTPKASPDTANSTIATTVTASRLSPRPATMLKKSASKQSLASTLNSMEVSSASVLSSASTDATSVSRNSFNTDESSTIDSLTGLVVTKSLSTATTTTTTATTVAKVASTVGTSNTSSEAKYLNSQIEDLLTALSKLQRSQALLVAELRQEQEDRQEDKNTVKSLLVGLRSTPSLDGEPGTSDDEEGTTIGGLFFQSVQQLLVPVEQRFGLEAHKQAQGNSEKQPSMGPTETKSQLREDLEHTKERLAEEEARGIESKRRILDLQMDISTLKDQLKESRDHARVLHADKQRLEKQIHGMRVRGSTDTHRGNDQASRQSTAPLTTGASGLREFKLGRSKSTPEQGPQFNKRTSSMPRGASDASGITVTPVSAPANEHEALLLELVQAKTAEAIAKQEAEEAKAKLDKLRRQFGISVPNNDKTLQGGSTGSAAAVASNAASAAMGVFGRLTGNMPPVETSRLSRPSTPSSTTAASLAVGNLAAGSSAGGFWGWKRQ